MRTFSLLWQFSVCLGILGCTQHAAYQNDRPADYLYHCRVLTPPIPLVPESSIVSFEQVDVTADEPVLALILITGNYDLPQDMSLHVSGSITAVELTEDGFGHSCDMHELVPVHMDAKRAVYKVAQFTPFETCLARITLFSPSLSGVPPGYQSAIQLVEVMGRASGRGVK